MTKDHSAFFYEQGYLDALKRVAELAPGRSAAKVVAQMSSEFEGPAAAMDAAQAASCLHENLTFKIDFPVRCDGCKLEGNELLLAAGWKRTKKGKWKQQA